MSHIAALVAKPHEIDERIVLMIANTLLASCN